MKMNFELKSKWENNQSVKWNESGFKKQCEIAEIESDFLVMESILKATEDRLASKGCRSECY